MPGVVSVCTTQAASPFSKVGCRAPLNCIASTGRGIISAQIMVGCIPLLIPLAMWLPVLALPLLIATEALVACTNTIFCINRDSLIQTITPNRLLGRVGASRSVIGLGVATAGVCIGGLLAERIGVPATVVLGCCGELPAFLWLLFSPVRALRELPMPQADGAAIDIG